MEKLVGVVYVPNEHLEDLLPVDQATRDLKVEVKNLRKLEDYLRLEKDVEVGQDLKAVVHKCKSECDLGSLDDEEGEEEDKRA